MVTGESEHETNRKTENVFLAVEYEVLCLRVAIDVGCCEAFGYIVKAIFEREIKEYAPDIDAHAYHEAEIDGRYAFGNLGVVKVFEVVDTHPSEYHLGFWTTIE